MINKVFIRLMMIFSFSLFLATVTKPDSIYAATVSTSVNVVPDINSELQIEGESNINYNVIGKEGKKINSSLSVTNIKKEEIKISLRVNNGLTLYGQVSYEPVDNNGYSGFIDESYMMSNIITGLPNEITLKPNETKNIDFVINVPKNLKGQYIGTIRFEDITSDSSSNEEDSSIFDYKVAYSMGVWLKGKEEKLTSMEIAEADIGNTKGIPTILVKLINANTGFLKDQDLDYKVYKVEGSKEHLNLIFEGKEKLSIVSPKNYFWHSINWEGQLSSGSYMVEVNGKRFPFEIKKDMLPDQKDDSVIFVEKDSIPLWVWIILSFLLLFIFFLLLRRKKKKSETDDENKVDSEDSEDEPTKVDDSNDEDNSNDPIIMKEDSNQTTSTDSKGPNIDKDNEADHSNHLKDK